jgi:hypothetical protein
VTAAVLADPTAHDSLPTRLASAPVEAARNLTFLSGVPTRVASCVISAAAARRARATASVLVLGAALGYAAVGGPESGKMGGALLVTAAVAGLAVMAEEAMQLVSRDSASGQARLARDATRAVESLAAALSAELTIRGARSARKNRPAADLIRLAHWNGLLDDRDLAAWRTLSEFRSREEPSETTKELFAAVARLQRTQRRFGTCGDSHAKVGVPPGVIMDLPRELAMASKSVHLSLCKRASAVRFEPAPGWTSASSRKVAKITFSDPGPAASAQAATCERGRAGDLGRSQVNS